MREPWVQGAENPRLVFDREDRVVAVASGPQEARRIVAAINAVAGIPSRALEAGFGRLWWPEE